MTMASSLAFPGSRTLAGWWRQLAPYHPQIFGVGYLFLHRVEAPVCLLRSRKTEPFLSNLLQVLALETASESVPGVLLDRLETRLHLGRQVIFQLLRTLESENLVAGDIPTNCALTPKGQNALHQGEYLFEVFERRVFHFLERLDPAGARSGPPGFVNWQINLGQAWQPGDTFPFDARLLHHCLQRDESWKLQVGFPRNVRAILDLASEKEQGAPEALAWQRVIVVRPERFLVVWAIVPVPQGGSSLLVFPARQEGWVLQTSQPALQMAQGWQDLFPDQAAGPDQASLAGTWQNWAKTRGLPESETAPASPALAGHRLQVRVSPALLERLRASRSDVFKGDTWLLIGDGHLRSAALLEVIG